MTTTLQLEKRVQRLERAIRELKRIDPDTILSGEDREAIKAYRKERAAGTLVPWESVKRRLKLA